MTRVAPNFGVRHCAAPGCTRPLTRNEGESAVDFASRITCSKPCLHALRALRMRARVSVEIGQRVGNMTVRAFVGRQPYAPHALKWLCAYDCGHTLIYTTAQLFRYTTTKRVCEKCNRLQFYKYQGKKQTIAAWARELGLNDSTLRGRLDAGKAFTEAVQGGRRNEKPVDIDGTLLSQAEIARRLGVSRQAVGQRLARGWKPTAQDLAGRGEKL